MTNWVGKLGPLEIRLVRPALCRELDPRARFAFQDAGALSLAEARSEPAAEQAPCWNEWLYFRESESHSLVKMPVIRVARIQLKFLIVIITIENTPQVYLRPPRGCTLGFSLCDGAF